MPAIQPPTTAAFLLPDSFGDLIGEGLVAGVSRQLREDLDRPPVGRRFEGPHFVYDDNTSLFLGRRGRGPLRIAWDTNLLIDYFEHGRALWENESLPELVPGTHGEELEGLQILMAVWILRDIRFYILTGTLGDAKRALSARRLGQRLQAFREFAGALSFVADDDQPREPPPLVLPESELRRALTSVPAGNDRGLVEEAVQQRMHVFLTRDANVLRAKPALRAFGLFVATPLDLVEEMASCGALYCLTDPRFVDWPLPDRERVARTSITRHWPTRTAPANWSSGRFGRRRSHLGVELRAPQAASPTATAIP